MLVRLSLFPSYVIPITLWNPYPTLLLCLRIVYAYETLGFLGRLPLFFPLFLSCCCSSDNCVVNISLRSKSITLLSQLTGDHFVSIHSKGLTLLAQPVCGCEHQPTLKRLNPLGSTDRWVHMCVIAAHGRKTVNHHAL